MEMKIILVLWICICSKNYAMCLTDYTGVDIGYSCKHDAECKAGNGGEFSKCNKDLHICICTINHLGEDKCMHDSDKYDRVCRPVMLFDEPGLLCTLECSPVGTRKQEEGHDWYGEIFQPFASMILDKMTCVCYDPWRAFNSVPDGFELKPSTIPNAGLGAFTNIYIEQDTVFGPYKGIFDEDADSAETSGYSWRIDPRKDENRAGTVWVDAKDIALSNWLRYGNTPTTAAMENLVAIQRQGEMFYQAFRSIQPGAELLVWFGASYGEFLEIEQFEPPRYYFAYPGYVGGSCEEEDEGQHCFHDKNTVCADKTCFCTPGTHNRAGMCISDETLGGVCVGLDGETCKHDKNAGCQRGVCVCKNKTSPANGVCIADETFGGRCVEQNGHNCLLDNNAECVNGLCRCRYGTTGIGGKCVTDEAYQGRCIGNNGIACELDKNAECWDNICICKKNASVVNGKCELDEMVGGRCKDDEGKQCRRDKNAMCIDGLCKCKSGTSSINGTCRIDETLGGKCKSMDGLSCTLDDQTICYNGICVCKKGTTNVDGMCISDGSLKGMCIEGSCLGQDMVCDTESNTCVCQAPHPFDAGNCVKE